MDFFAHQDKARSKSGQLIFLFILAVLAVICAVYFAVIAVFFYASTENMVSEEPFSWFDGRLFLIIGGVTLAVIAVASLLKIKALSKGGTYVAESLGGRILNRSTTDRNERKLLNVVEEMSIASGIPVPQIYILDGEKSINAFAAGYTPSDAVVGVTEGCMKILSRDELQGVVAHEFSHILNGDMRLNIQLIGGLSGIMTISQIGSMILRSSGRRHRSSRSGNDGAAIYLFALLLLIIGSLGIFFARLIQSALSRQREFLADASAVQFTRNPFGIGGALKKIGGLSFGSAIQSPAAGESCHMFFGKAIKALFSTHPPLKERILCIDPSFSGTFPRIEIPKDEECEIKASASGFVGDEGVSLTLSADRISGLAGTISDKTVEYSADIIASIPPYIAARSEDMAGAASIIMALLLDKGAIVRERQYDIISKKLMPALAEEVKRIEMGMMDLDPRLRLPVADMAMPALRMMSESQLDDFLEAIDLMIKADQKITLFEFALKTIISHRLKRAIKKAREKVLIKDIGTLSEEISILLSILSVSGHKDAKKAEVAFQSAGDSLPFKSRALNFNPKVGPKVLEEALNKLSLSSPAIKKRVLDACSQSVLFDGKVNVKEAELLRATAYAMDIPLPPLPDMA